jgi:class 3 adenylate cyclase
MYRRYRRHYVGVVFATVGVMVYALLIVPLIAVLCLALHTTFAAGVLVLGVVGVNLLIGAVVSLRAVRTMYVPARAWLADPGADPVAACEVFVSAPQVGTNLVVAIEVVLQLLITTPLVRHLADLSFGGTAIVGAYLTIWILVVGVFTGVSAQLLYRPVIEELVNLLPREVEITKRGWTLRNRFHMTVVFACLSTGPAVSAVGHVVSGPEERFAAAVGLSLAIGGYVVWLCAGGVVESTFRPILDLMDGVNRVRRGDFATRVPVTSFDELADLATAFNEMQKGLAERETLHAAFGSYVDPALAQRLLDSGSSMFEGEELEVTVLFADVRDFTQYAEGVGAAEAVARLNRLFDVMVPVIHAHGGHANHYLGDGLLAVFGAPVPLRAHADAAVAAAIEIQQQLRDEIGDSLRLGIGINTGSVIAGTVGGGGRHEFTVIGDTVNSAARVEQLTKDTGDAILITEATRLALSTPRPRSTKRGEFEVRGKARKLTLHAINPSRRTAPTSSR